MNGFRQEDECISVGRCFGALAPNERPFEKDAMWERGSQRFTGTSFFAITLFFLKHNLLTFLNLSSLVLFSRYEFNLFHLFFPRDQEISYLPFSLFL